MANTKYKFPLPKNVMVESIGSEVIITIKYPPRFFGLIKEHYKVYIGDSTVWHHYPSGKKCNSDTDFMLYDIWKQWCRGNEVSREKE